MPSPFPGMDPYLEGSEWMSFHAEFCVEIARQLRPLLRPRYVAQPIKRFITDTTYGLVITNDETKNLYPDVGIAQLSPQRSHRPRPLVAQPVAIFEPTLQLETVMPEFVPQYAVEIRDVEERRLVTLIEVLSPANKYGEGYEEYIAKRQRVLRSNAHLLEIDLLRKGKRVPMRKPLPAAQYFIFLSRVERRPITDIWKIMLQNPLPRIPVPLLPSDVDIPLDLGAAFTSVYDSVGYDLLIDYSKPPEVTLVKDEVKQSAQILQKYR